MDYENKLELARSILREVLKHPDFWPPRPLVRNPALGEICPQCGADDSHYSFCLIGAIQDVLAEHEPKERDKVGPLRVKGRPVTNIAASLRRNLSNYEGK